MTEQSNSDDRGQTTALVRTSPSSVVQRKAHAISAYGRSQPYIFCTREEYLAIFNACTSERDALLIRALWETGARVSEIIALRECDIGDGYLILPNLKQREGSKNIRKQVMLNPGSDLLVKLLLYCRKNDIAGLARLWPFSKEWAEKIFREASTKAGVYKPARRNRKEVMAPAWPHTFRHSNAHYLARSGVPGPIIRDNLGHSSLQVTSRYLEFTSAERREAMRRAEL
jgi:integrase/recombinase XerD